MKLPQSLRRFVHTAAHMHLSIYAGNAAFFLTLSIFPLFGILLSLLQYTDFTHQNFLGMLELFIPKPLFPLFSFISEELSAKPSVGLFSISALTAIWSSSKGLHSILYGLNAAANAKETRSYVLRRILCACYMIVLLLSLLAVLFLHLFGQTMLRVFQVVNTPFFQILLFILKHLQLYALVLLTFLFSLLYLALPNRKERFFRILPGAASAALGWILFSYLFSCYTKISSGYTQFYGSLSLIAMSLVWLYFCLQILFYGALFNRVLFRSE